jgi:hypothetical protein
MSDKLTVTENDKKGVKLKEICIKCASSTNHEIVANHLLSWEQEVPVDHFRSFTIDGTDDYQMIKCLGCDSVSLRHTSYFSEDYDPTEEHGGARTTLYPKRSKHTVAERSFPELPPVLKRIYRETVDCFNNESYTLAATGLRILIEGLCAELCVKDGPTEGGKRSDKLVGKINGLAEKKYLTESDSEALHEHRILGNEAVHDLGQASMDEIRLAIKIVEHTLSATLEIPNLQATLRAKRASRIRK